MNFVSWNNSNGYLVINYLEETGQLKSIKFNDLNGKSTKIYRSNIWINDMPAEYLKLFTLSKIQEANGGKLEESKDNNNYKLKFDNWGWWKAPNPCEEIRIGFSKHSIKSTENSYFVIPSCLKILCLKKFIQEKFDKEKDYEFKGYLIFFNNDELGDEYTLKECGIKFNDKITYLFQKEPEKISTALQGGTKGTFHSIKDFQNFFKDMTERIGFVCLIELGDEFGTGFLIGEDLIMTNAHVLKNGLKSLKKNSTGPKRATFFYDNEEGKDKIIVDLDLMDLKLPIHVSPTPGKKKPTLEKLDFTILKFNKPPFEEEAKKIQEWAENAASFFQLVKNPNHEHANIIQHPNCSSKQIVFKGTRIYGRYPHQFEIHYETKTDGGSSGSAVINNQGELIGLHYATCTLIERGLTQYKRQLFIELKLGIYKKSETMYSKFSNCPELQVHRKGEYKGYCIVKTDQFFLLELIERCKIENPRAWAVDFLKKQGVRDLTEHIECNIAIRISKIFENLQNEFPAVFSQSEEQRLLKAEDFKKSNANKKDEIIQWSDESDESESDESAIQIPESTFLYKHRYKILGAIAFTGIFSYIFRKQISDSRVMKVAKFCLSILGFGSNRTDM